ncbi:M48 family metallopeptidase [Alkalimarinus coralli]|uniref:M48 family metallopeptidase n=1 Tax=Alkalimarinus coralli TaxID=2935863 RepID=UPI00202B4381|nr:M48 family metallopeptidase [Alkalimarinus coralli]
MNFFDHQAIARKKSLLLGILFLIAVTLIVGITNLACYYALTFAEAQPLSLQQWFVSRPSIYISATLTAIIVSGSLYQFFNLSKGGQAVAEMARGRKVDTDSSDLLEQKFINLVEEMSIASGTMMPELYIMDHEHSINAFVAGYEPTECVLVVTKGALEKLSRDELQGVIGHEFSHILNGDMRINIRLIAVLAGILLIGQIGQFLVSSAFNRSHSYRSGRNRGDVALLGVGLVMICIGYTGLFFGRIIKAAISRQREFLADAASVQFTRNPEGIAGALYKIYDDQDGSRLRFTHHAEDINHLCFSESVKMHLSGLLASHPPLKERITTIGASYFVRFKARAHKARKRSASSPEEPVGIYTNSPQEITNTTNIAPHVNSLASQMAASTNTQAAAPHQPIEYSIGSVSPAHIDYAASLLQSIPARVKQLAHSSSGAQSLILSLMLNEAKLALDKNAFSQLSTSTQANLKSNTYNEVALLLKDITVNQRTPILELAIPSLKKLSTDQRSCFIDDLSTIANLDAKITFYEFALITLTKQQLNPSFGRKVISQYHSFKSVTNEVAIMLKLFAMASTPNKTEQQLHFRRAVRTYSDDIRWEDDLPCSVKGVSHALNKLRLLSPLLKRPLIDSFVECVMEDNEIKPREYELLRLVAIVLDCPIPPLLVPTKA